MDEMDRLAIALLVAGLALGVVIAVAPVGTAW